MPKLTEAEKYARSIKSRLRALTPADLVELAAEVAVDAWKAGNRQEAILRIRQLGSPPVSLSALLHLARRLSKPERSELEIVLRDAINAFPPGDEHQRFLRQLAFEREYSLVAKAKSFTDPA